MATKSLSGHGLDLPELTNTLWQGMRLSAVLTAVAFAITAAGGFALTVFNLIPVTLAFKAALVVAVCGTLLSLGCYVACMFATRL